MRQELTFTDVYLAPLLSLFSPRFYRKVLHSSLGKGIFYLFYFGLVLAIGLTIAFHFFAKPQAEEFVGWLKTNLPEIRFTPTGAFSTVQQPFTLEHPKLGTLFVLDTSKTDPDLENIPAQIYLTKTKLIVKQRDNYRIMDIVPKDPNVLGETREFTVNGEMMENLYKQNLPLLYCLVFFGVFLFFFVWKVVSAVFYSLIALILNQMRKEKLSYSQLLNCSIFAMTAVTFLQVISLFPLPTPLNINFFAAVVLTSGYLAVVILAIKEDSSPAGFAG